MRDSALYVAFWSALLPKIKSGMEIYPAYFNIELKPEWFDSLGNRKSYRFRLEINEGKAVNNISGSAVARDLY